MWAMSGMLEKNKKCGLSFTLISAKYNINNERENMKYKVGDKIKWHIRPEATYLHDKPKMEGMIISVFPDGKSPYVGKHNAFMMVKVRLDEEKIKRDFLFGEDAYQTYAVNMNNSTIEHTPHKYEYI